MCFDIGIVTCGPNEALVISGFCQGGGPSYIHGGGRAFVFPGKAVLGRDSKGISQQNCYSEFTSTILSPP